MTDLDLMTARQMWTMGAIALFFWLCLARIAWRELRGPRRTRQTYRKR